MAGAPPEQLVNARAETERLNEATRDWHHTAGTAAFSEDLLLSLHGANFVLWHLEDSARDPSASDSTIAEVKHQIDSTNQQRNDFVERIDLHLLAKLQPSNLPHAGAPLHSETPGMILDRLSILSLKLFHTAEEARRKDATPQHVMRNQERLSTLQQQQSDLAGCLATLWQEVCLGTRRFQLYRQMKMYNDPDLNPVLYRAHRRAP